MSDNSAHKNVHLPGLRKTIDEIAKERNLPASAVQTALSEALLKGYERYRRSQQMEKDRYDEEYFDNFEVLLNLEEETFQVVANRTVVEEVSNPDREISLEEVRSSLQSEYNNELSEEELFQMISVGDSVFTDATPDRDDFGRMAAIQAKQVLAQKLRDRQRQIVQEEFEQYEGTALVGRVLRFERQSAIIAVNSSFGQPDVEAELPLKEQLPNDNYRIGRTFKVFLKKVREGSPRGPQLLVSRAAAGLVVELFATEVPEIEEELVRIVAVAREANPPSRQVGPRTKIAVDTLEGDVDPVGACIGARGSRIQVVVNELQGEKIDVIRWSPDPGTYIANALSPARIEEIRLVYPEGRQAHAIVPEDQLSLAIGKEGQNVRLAARLTGWKIDVKNASKYDAAAEMAVVQVQIEADRAIQAERAARGDFDADEEEYEDEES
jgi:transcription termination/antitermination protein NusA